MKDIREEGVVRCMSNRTVNSYWNKPKGKEYGTVNKSEHN